MRLFKFLVLLVVILIGLVFGALNAEPVAVSVGWRELRLPLGAWLLGAAAIGALVAGLLVWLVSVLPLHRELRALRRLPVLPDPEAEPRDE